MDDLKQNGRFFPNGILPKSPQGKVNYDLPCQKHWATRGAPARSSSHNLGVKYILSGAGFSVIVCNAYIHIYIIPSNVQYDSMPYHEIKSYWEKRNSANDCFKQSRSYQCHVIIWKQVWEQTTIEHLVDIPSCGLSVSSRKCWGSIYWFMWTGHVDLIGRLNTFNHPGPYMVNQISWIWG